MTRKLRNTTELSKKVVPSLRECSRQSQAEVVSKSSNKIHQTWNPHFSRALHIMKARVPPSNLQPLNSVQCLQANPPPHFVSLLVVFLGYGQTVATPPLICLLYGRISEALADGLSRLASSAASAATTGRRSRQRKKTGSSEVSINATPKTSLSNGFSQI